MTQPNNPGVRALNLIKKHWFWISVAIFLCVFFWLTPLQVDDYTFRASYRYIHSVGSFFTVNGYIYDHINGRVLGNLLSLMGAASRIGSAVVRAAITLVALISAIKLLSLERGTRRNFLVAVIFFVPIGIFGSTYGWAAGFYNYVTPLAVILLILFLLTKWSKQSARNSIRKFARVGFIFLLGLAGALCVENVTMTLGALLIGCLGYSLRRPLKLARNITASALLGCLAGAAIMFSAPVYGKVISGHNGYQQIGRGVGGLIEQLASNTTYLTSYLVNSALILYVLALALVLIIPFLSKKTLGKSTVASVKNSLAVIIGVTSLVYLALSPYINHINGHPVGSQFVLALIEFAAAAGIFLSLTLLTWWNVGDKTRRGWALLFISLAVVSLLPLLIAWPITARVVYSSYIFFVLYLFTLINSAYMSLDSSIRAKLFRPAYLQVSYVLLLASALIFLGIFGAIRGREISNANLAHKQIAAGETTVTLKKYPFFDFMYQDSYLSPWPSMYFSGSKCLYRECDQIHVTVEYQ